MAYGRVFCSFTESDSIAEDSLFISSSKNRVGFGINKINAFLEVRSSKENRKFLKNLDE
jgi:hypothetical protein